MDQKISFVPEKTPTWSALTDLLASRQYLVEMRMIDGELAFPDETPPETWREVRVGTPGGMITLRREADGVTAVVWGNADVKMKQAWNALAWAIAHLSDGRVGAASAAEFAASADLPFTDAERS